MSTENYGLAVACFQVYYASYGITKYTKCNISHAYSIYTSHIYQYVVIRKHLSN